MTVLVGILVVAAVIMAVAAKTGHFGKPIPGTSRRRRGHWGVGVGRSFGPWWVGFWRRR